MSYARPFVTPSFTAYAGDSQTKDLSLAVNVVDTFTDLPAAVKLRVLLKERKQSKAIFNLRGLFCFEEVPDGHYTLVTEPDRVTADWFFLEPAPGDPWPSGFESKVTLPVKGAQAPLVDVLLAPNPSYPFPPGATLLRGRVTHGGANHPAAGGVVSVDYDQADPQDPQHQTVVATIATQTDADGEYVLFFQELPAANQAVTVVAAFNGQQLQHQANIREGRAVSLPFAFP